MSSASQPTTNGNPTAEPITADQLREKVRQANAQSEANRLSKGGR